MLSQLVKIAFTALALAFWQLFGQPLWNRWIESMGHSVGFAETFLGWFIVLCVAWILAGLATGRMRE